MNQLKSFFKGAPGSLQVLLVFCVALPLWSLSIAEPFNNQMATFFLSYWLLPIMGVFSIIKRSIMVLPIFVVLSGAIAYQMISAEQLTGHWRVVSYFVMGGMTFIGILLTTKDVLFPFLSRRNRSWRKASRVSGNLTITIDLGEHKSIKAIVQDLSVTGLSFLSSIDQVRHLLSHKQKGDEVTFHIGVRPYQGRIIRVLENGKIADIGIEAVDPEGFEQILQYAAPRLRNKGQQVTFLWASSSMRRAAIAAWTACLSGAMIVPSCGNGGEIFVPSGNHALAGEESDETESKDKKKKKSSDGKAGDDDDDDDDDDDSNYSFPKLAFTGGGCMSHRGGGDAFIKNFSTEVDGDQIIMETTKSAAGPISPFSDNVRDQFDETMQGLVGRQVFTRPSQEERKEMKDYHSFIFYATEGTDAKGKHVSFSNPLPAMIIPQTSARFKKADRETIYRATVQADGGSFEISMRVVIESLSNNAATVGIFTDIPSDTRGEKYNLIPFPRDSRITLDLKNKLITRMQSMNLVHDSKTPNHVWHTEASFEICQSEKDGETESFRECNTVKTSQGDCSGINQRAGNGVAAITGGSIPGLR